MKKTAGIAAACLLLANVGGFAQPDSAKRDITVKVVDRKGEPVSNIAVQASSAETGGATDKDGVCLLPGLQNGDSVTLVFPRIGEVYVPVQEGIDVVVLTLKSNRELTAVNSLTNQTVDLGYGGVARNRSTGAATVIDVPALLKETGGTTIAELLTGQVPGLQVTESALLLRGKSSGALIVVDGVEIEPMMGFTAFQSVESRYNVHGIQTITVDPIGAAYGFRGSNGVVLITTKR